MKTDLSLPASTAKTVITCTFLGAAGSVLFQQTLGTCGDYPQHFQALYLGIMIGAVGGGIVTLLMRKLGNDRLIYPFCITLIRYFMASILLSYGIVKIFATQFPHMMANMDSRFIELNPMRVAWTFFGYSRGYQMFLGWGELIPGILLLFRRTWLLGAIFSVIVMLNVFMINIFFDVCLKLNSGLYTALSLYLVLQKFDPLWKFFISKKETVNAHFHEATEPSLLNRSSLIVNILFVVAIIGWATKKSFETYAYSTRIASLPAVQGAWQTDAIEQWGTQGWSPLRKKDSLFAEKIYFEGSLGVIKSNFIRDRFILEANDPKSELTLTFRSANNEFLPAVKWKYNKPEADSLVLTGRWRNDSLRFLCIRNKEKLTRY